MKAVINKQGDLVKIDKNGIHEICQCIHDYEMTCNNACQFFGEPTKTVRGIELELCLRTVIFQDFRDNS